LKRLESEKKNTIVELSFEFALEIIEFTEQLELEKKFVIGRQLLKSGTSIGANVREAQSAESKADFIHKIKIAAKEAEETEYWLLLCQKAKNYPNCETLLQKINIISKVISKIISSSKSNSKIG
jgi:four helix bundle protein